MKKNKNLRVYMLIGVFGVLALSSIFMTIETATSGVEISKLEDREVALSNKKRDLEESLVKTLSYVNLSEKSTEMGFSKPENLVYINTGEAVAKLP